MYAERMRKMAVAVVLLWLVCESFGYRLGMLEPAALILILLADFTSE